MKRLIIVCEGPTESEFCNDVLAPLLLKNDIYLETPLIKKSNGGIVPWSNIKKQIEMHLHEDEVHVSMLIDYYGIKDSYLFPGWEESKNISVLDSKLDFLCNKMKEEFDENIAYRFIPYMQIHEFESLLFSNIEVFVNNFDLKTELDFSILEKTIKEFSNPEEINTRPTFAPSKRIMKAIPGYEKIIYGSCLATEIGLETIRAKCPLFNQWITKLLSI